LQRASSNCLLIVMHGSEARLVYQRLSNISLSGFVSSGKTTLFNIALLTSTYPTRCSYDACENFITKLFSGGEYSMCYVYASNLVSYMLYYNMDAVACLHILYLNYSSVSVISEYTPIIIYL